MNITATIDRFEGDKAVFKLDSGETVVWPKDKIPSEAKEGSIITINFLSDSKTENSKRDQAKEILQEILNPQD